DSWGTMSESEREQMTSAYRRIITEMVSAFKGSKDADSKLRVLRVKEMGDSAEGLIMHSTELGEFLEKWTFAKAEGGWYLVEAFEADTGLQIVSELLKPTIWQIADRRIGKTGRTKSATNLVRVLVALNEDPKSAVAVADEILKDEPNDRAVLYARGLALSRDEKTADAAVEVWKKLSAESQPIPSAVLKLATALRSSCNEHDQAQPQT